MGVGEGLRPTLGSGTHPHHFSDEISEIMIKSDISLFACSLLLRMSWFGMVN